MDVEKLRELAVEALEERKGRDIVVLDLRERSSFTDYMVIASGGSERQVKALAENVIYQAKHHGVQPLGSEGVGSGEWALVDLIDVVVHVMLPQTRDFYNLEKLWAPEGHDDEAQRAGA